MKDKARRVTAEITMADLKKKARKRLRKARGLPLLTPKEIRKRMRKLLPAKLAEIEAKKAKGLPPFDKEQGADKPVVMQLATGVHVVLTADQFADMVGRFERRVEELRQERRSSPPSEPSAPR